MSAIKFIRKYVYKYLKGLFSIYLLWLFAAIGVFVFDSCKKADYESSESGLAARKFNDTMQFTRPILGSIDLTNSTKLQDPLNQNLAEYYLTFPPETSQDLISGFSSNVTIQSLTNVLENNGVSIDSEATPQTTMKIIIDEEPIRAALQPLVADAKNYLMSKGMTYQQITEMIQLENAEEIDLIPFVRILTAVEQDQYLVRNIFTPFFNEAYAGVLECGVAALGASALVALAQSTASTWSWPVILSAFRVVARKMLGPIGVAVAVVTFTICMIAGES